MIYWNLLKYKNETSCDVLQLLVHEKISANTLISYDYNLKILEDTTMQKRNADHSPELNKLIMQVVQNQLNDVNTPYVRETYTRLLAAGHTDAEARSLIGSAAVCEIYDVMKENQPFNEERYRKALNALR